MDPADVRRACEAATAVARTLGLRVDDAAVLHNSNRVAVRLLPCGVLARVGPLSHQAGLEFEVEMGAHLARTGAPLAVPEPRARPHVYLRDDLAVTLWTYYEPQPPFEVAPAEYAQALGRLHAGLRHIAAPSPHFTDRVADAQRILADRELSPELNGTDRDLLTTSLTRASEAICSRAADEQLLHGEPHVGNVLRTREGLLFIDLETCCRGPVEFDIGHALLPDDNGRVLSARELAGHYPGADEDAIEQSVILIWAMVTTWRWRHGDELPNGQHWRVEGLRQLRDALHRHGMG